MEKGAIRVVLLSAQTATQASIPVDVRDYQELTVYATGTGTVTGGTVLVEEADWDPFDSAQIHSGAWSAIPGATITASAVSAGAQQALHLPAPSAYAFVRVRISGTITGGGTVTVALRAG